MVNKQIQKEWYIRNRAARLAYSKKYREEHKEEINKYLQENREKKNLYDKERYSEKRESYLFNGAKWRAKKSGIVFSIDKSDVFIPDTCPYLGVPITCEVGKGKVNTNPSIDRIDSTKGYIKENVQVISFIANRMKNNASEELLIAFAKGVLKLHAGIDIDKTIALLGELQQVSKLYKNTKGE